jgi:hypothetical protein
MWQLFEKLGYERSNGLFFIEDADQWMSKFPYRIGRVLKDIIRPYAFYSPFHGETSTDQEHPEPLNNPIILFFDHPDEEVVQNIPRWTFSFSQAPIVIINRDDYGPLEIYHGYNFDGRDQKWLKKIDTNDVDISDFSVLNLSTGRTWEKLYEKYFKSTPKVDKYLLKNIIDARRILIAKDTGGLTPKIANRLIGRLLFIRYLIDRDVSFENESYIHGNSKEKRRCSFEDLLKNKEKTYRFFKSITKQFNGDLFPLVEDEKGVIVYDEENVVRQEHLDVMYYLFTCSEFFKEGETWKDYSVQRSFFNFYDFEVIPVELISNIYENFLAKSETKDIENKNLKELAGSRQEEIKAYYTPPFLVDYVLSQTVTPHLEMQEKASCKVLDPACGSGIFLVETLRKIIEKERQVTSGPIPDGRLWELVRENIFGIDIDNEAIEITIFSIYITLLDYKTPKEIKSFRFERLKEENLFGGETADFFNESHLFNDKFKNKINLDFIIGNPPWGIIKTSQYNDYIKNRNEKEKKENPDRHIKLEIGHNEISQAFMVRVSDFAAWREKTKCVFIVTGKNIYNTAKTTKTWRNYFLNKFHIKQILELSSVNNKIVGGNQIFESARQSVVVISYYPAKNHEETSKNVIRHITVRPNRFFNYFKTIVIEKQDVKKVLQKYFIESKGGYDWLWKVFLHGNILDFLFIKRLKENYMTFGQLMKKHNLIHKGGLKLKDKHIEPGKMKSTKPIEEWNFLEVDSKKEFQPFQICPTQTWKQKAETLALKKSIYECQKVAHLPDIYFFKGKKLLFKKGLKAAENFKGVAAFSDSNIVFTSTVCSVKPDIGVKLTEEIEYILKIIVGLFNSRFFTYFLLSTSTSLGVDRTRADFDEFLALPVVINKKIGQNVIEIQTLFKELNKLQLPGKEKKLTEEKIRNLKEEIEKTILEVYEISDQEKSLIDYAIDVSIPVLKREEVRRNQDTDIFAPLTLNSQDDKHYLTQYADVFIDHFGERFNDAKKYFIVDVHITASFIGFHFKIIGKPCADKRVFFMEDADVKEMIDKIGELGYHKLIKDLYIRQDIRGFNKSSFYVIKPNQRKPWHKAAAYADLSEFVESLVKAEIKEKIA